MSALFLAPLSLAIALIALLFERRFGYPQALFGRIGHPVSWIGAVIADLEKHLNRSGRRDRKLRGSFTLFLVLLVVAAVTVPLALVLRALPGGFVIEALLASTLLAQKELARSVRAVAFALHAGIDEARAALSHIVGRDTSALDEPAIARAAVESLAENASDGVTAPLFWLVIAGLPGAALYKAINTADSMIGYRNERYRDFGFAAARIDDAVNWIPARLTGALLALAAPFAGGKTGGALSAMRCDARRHASPNAGWPEAAMAGALGFKLGGPRSYGGGEIAGAWLGNGRAALGSDDIVRALELYRRLLDFLAGLLALGGLFALLAFLF